jgi:hypothetical protein
MAQHKPGRWSMIRSEASQPGGIADPRFLGLYKNATPKQRGRPPGFREEYRVPVKGSELMVAEVKNTPLDELLDGLARYRHDPLGFVMWAFPWGEAGTPLADMDGPEEWQREQLDRIGTRLRAGAAAAGDVIQEDTASGHGIGKSAQVAWMILWATSTCADTRGVVTAGTDGQLKTKTWAELSKWHGMFIAKSLFKLTATRLSIDNDPEREMRWRVDAVPWSKENSEAFAGLHNQGSRILLLFDEASAIDDIISEVAEGALTDANTEIIWLRYGNPTKTSGFFFKKCSQPGFVNRVGQGITRAHPTRSNVFTEVDSRAVSFSNKKQIQAWIDEYGIDSDFVRVRVLGKFPRAGYANFISPELVYQAQRRVLGLTTYQAFPKFLAVDPARFGDDFSVITLRQGMKVHYQVALGGFDGVDLAGRIFEICRKEPGISCIAYDAIGNGADLDSALRRIHGLPHLIPVQWGQPAKDDKQYFNQRSECWGKMRDWLENGQIPDSDELANELTSLDYGNDAKFRVQLQSKKDIKKNGGKSPDRADSLALTFIPELIDRKVTSAKVRPVQRRTVVWNRST